MSSEGNSLFMQNSYRLIRLELNGYNRLALSGIKRIELTPQSALQLILGSNGSGKSSLLEEISPLPAHSSNFTKDGSKVSEWYLNGNKYKLESIFTNGSQKHYFWKDGQDENLNPGGTLTVQRQLVLEHFGIDAEIQGLILGNEVFTQMSPTRRREWFTRMGESNYDYALGVFKKLKEKHRDVVGALKLAKFTLVEETAKRLKPEEVDQLRLSLKEHKTQLSWAIRQIGNEHFDLSQTEQQYETTRNLFINTVKTLKKGLGKAHTWVFNQTPESIAEVIQALEKEYSATEEAIQRLTDEFVKVENIIGQLHAAGLEDIAFLNRATEETNSRIAELQTCLVHSELLWKIAEMAGFNNVQSVIGSVETYLRELSYTLPNNAERTLSKKVELEHREVLQALVVEFKKLEHDLQRADVIIKEHVHLRDHAQSQCPKCKHLFSQGFSQTTLDEVTKEKDVIEKALVEKKTQIDQVQKLIDENVSYGNQIGQFIQALSPNYLQPLRAVIASDYLYNNPKGISTLMDQLNLDMGYFIEMHTLKEKQLSLNSLSHNETKAQLHSVSHLKARLVEISTEVETLTYNLNTAANRLKTYTAMRELLEELAALRQTANQLESQLVEHFKQRTIAQLNDMYSRLIFELESIVAKQESTLRAIDIREAYIREVEKDIEKYTQQEKAYALLIQSLSPTDGIIAESLHAFMNVFVSQMNQFIEKVWSYPLEILATQPESNESIELDYRFPFSVNNEKPLPDVSVGSRGMKEIFNLAFKMKAMQHLGLGHTPLFLDEFASSFDKEHRVMATHVINSLMNHQVFSQLFMVSHYEDSYTPLVDADICVLSDANVVVPVSERVNHHVVIE